MAAVRLLPVWLTIMNTPKHSWYKPRGYAHFDHPLGEADAEKLVGDKERIASHSFHPFIRYSVETQKVQRDPVTGLVTPKDPKSREISYASHADSHIYSFYGWKLATEYEQRLKASDFSDSVLAFRALGKSNIDFANDAFDYIVELGECVAFATDIVGFFDNLDHRQLKDAWCAIIGEPRLPADHFAVYKSLTRYALVQRDPLYQSLGISAHNPPFAHERLCTPDEFRTKVRGGGLVKTHPEQKGIPQGSPISALLSNIYLFEFDRIVHREITDRGGRYFRYCDDILCIVPMATAGNLADLVESAIKGARLTLHPGKTETIPFSKSSGALLATSPLQYLGFTFDGQRKLIRSAAFAKFSYNMRRGVNLARLTAKKHNANRTVAKPIWRSKLYERYSHLGRRNFISYGKRAADKMNAPSIRRQLRPWWKRLAERIKAADDDVLG